MPKIKTHFIVLGVLLFASACSPGYTVVRQARPNPFSQIHNFVIEPVHWENLQVGKKSEADWQAKKDAKEQASWQTDKAAMTQALDSKATADVKAATVSVAQAGAPVPAGTAIIRVFMNYIEPGQYAYVYRIATAVRTSVQLLDASGAVLDEFWMQSVEPATITDPSSGSRMRECAAHNGAILARYLNDRLAAK